MDRHNQKRLIRKLDLELFIASLKTQPTPNVQLEQYTTSEQIAANMLYIAGYINDDIAGKKILDLGCGTGRLGLGAAFIGAKSIVAIDIDPTAIKTAKQNSKTANLTGSIHFINGDIAAISGHFDTVLQNPPFGVQKREADRVFLIKAIQSASKIYSLHSHPEVDQRLLKLLKSNQNFIQVQPSPFLEHFIVKNGGAILAVYAMLMTIPRMFEFHHKLKHDFVVDLYIIQNTKSNE